jgi:hypothetical protein
MKKIFLSMLAVACLAGISMAQDKPAPDVTPPTPEQSAFQGAWEWLIQYENWNKEAAYKVIDDMRNKIQQEYPMDSKLQEAVNAVQSQLNASELAIAQKYGFATYEALYMDLKYKGANWKGGADKYEEVMRELKILENDCQIKQADLTRAYQEEFQKRFEAACVEAINRLKDNANAMK